MAQKRHAFTLVELLVVIAIIGLLSSVAIVSMSNSREKARIAGAQAFEAQIQRDLGSTAVLQYDFNEGSGTSVADTSGNANNGTFVGTPAWSTDTPYAGSAYSLNTSGSGNYVQTAGGLGLANSNFTIGMWIKTSSALAPAYITANTADSNGYRFGISAGLIIFLVGGNGGAGYTETTCGTQQVNDGKWHYIIGSFSRSSLQFSCYLDGRQIGTVAIAAATPNMRDTFTSVGASPFSARPFVGWFDNVRIYAQDMSGISYVVPQNQPRFAQASDRPREYPYDGT